MKIENERIQLVPIEPHRTRNLNQDQLEMLSLMQQKCSLQQIVHHYFTKGRLISFCDLLQLIEAMLKEKLIVNPNFYEFFQKQLTPPKGFFDQLVSDIFSPAKLKETDLKQIKEIPFFRSLSAEVLELFLEQATYMNVSKGVTLCQEGVQQRSLVVLLQGRASVYKKDKNGVQKKIVALNDSSIFGEAGFFFGEARTASVVADTDCQVLIIKYRSDVYAHMINTDKAKQLQQRIWAIHALLKSDMFRELPQKSFDAVIFAGGFKTIPTNTEVCRQGEIGVTCYIIVQGSVAVSQNSKFLRELGQGDTFGELALMVSSGERTATVVTTSETLVLEIHKDHFYRMLSENIMLGCEFEKLAKLRIHNAV